jgi:hypothetical protein
VKDLIIGIRTTSHKSGVYERCLNAAELYDEEIIALDKNESYTMESNFRAYDAKTANSLVSSFAVMRHCHRSGSGWPSRAKRAGAK